MSCRASSWWARLGALGVTHDAIVEDYTLTQATMERFLAAAADRDPDFTAALANTPTAFLMADPTAMSLVLTDLEREHGSLRCYVRSIGVPEADLHILDSMLLTD